MVFGYYERIGQVDHILLTSVLSRNYNCVRYFHPNLAKKAVLTASDFLMPRPPNFFGLHILSQTTNGNPLPVEDFSKKITG